MRKVKKPLLFTLALLPAAVAGACFAALMSVASMEHSQLEDAIRQIGSKELLVAAGMVQPVLLAVICGFFGYLLAEKIALMRPFRFERSALYRTLIVSFIGGGALSLDAWTFANRIPQLAQSYKSSGSFDCITWAASILYGGVIEEVMLRLFFMSLLAFLGWKLFCRTKEVVPTGVLIAANILAALAFAAAHLPATLQTFGTLTPMLLLRCFLLDGAFGLLFGRLYRNHGIQYAMLAHMLLHIVSRTIWLIAF